MDGFKATAVCIVSGGDAVGKARKTGDAILKRSSAILKKVGMEDFERAHITPIGAEDAYGKNAVNRWVTFSYQSTDVCF